MADNEVYHVHASRLSAGKQPKRTKVHQKRADPLFSRLACTLMHSKYTLETQCMMLDANQKENHAHANIMSPENNRQSVTRTENCMRMGFGDTHANHASDTCKTCMRMQNNACNTANNPTHEGTEAQKQDHKNTKRRKLVKFFSRQA